jgi:hypothetical protein
MVEGYATGRSADDLAGEMLRVLGDQATAKPAARLRVVGGDAKSDSSEEEVQP